MTDADLTRWLCEAGSLADILGRIRLAQGLTQEEVAEYAGVSRSFLSMLEHGDKSCERDTLITLLLAAFSLPVRQANRILLFAGFAPLHHRSLARRHA